MTNKRRISNWLRYLCFSSQRNNTSTARAYIGGVL